MAQSYSRQSSFTDGDTITSALFNNEYDQLVNAFTYSSSNASTTGHRHDGTSGQGGNVPQIGDLDFLNKIVVDDTNNRWGFYVQVSSSAVEQIRIQDGAIVPVTDNDIDLGTNSLEFKDAYFDGTVTSDAFAGPLTGNVTGNVSGTAATVTGAAQTNITSLGTLTAVTVSGEVDAGSLDVEGDADINGTLEADAITVDGTTLSEFIADTVGAMVSSNTETNITVTYQDADNTLDFNATGTISALNNATENELVTVGSTTTELDAEANLTYDGTTLGISGGSSNGVTVAQGAIKIKNGGAKSYIDLYCESSNAHYTRIEAAAHGLYSGNVTATLPVTTGTLALTSDIHTTEELQDITGAMFSSNTETGITATYQDADGTIDLVVGTLNQDTTGLAATATALATARTIHGVSFDGTANIDLSEVVQDTVGSMVSSNTESGITVAYQDGDGTLDFTIGTLNQDTTGTASKVTVTDSTANTNFPVVFNDESNALLDDTGALRYNPSTGTLLVPNLSVAGTTTQVDTVTMEASNAIIFEGATPDAHESTLTVIDPTADRTINLPNVSGTLPVLAVASTTQISSTPEELNILDGATVVVGEINALDLGATAVGTAIASKAVILDANKDYTGVRNFTLSGELDAGSLDVSGDVDVDGTLETDAFSINGTAVTSTAAELNLLDGVSGLVQADFTKLAAVDATATELNIMDGGTSASATTLADADRVVVNDNGTMKQVALTDFDTRDFDIVTSAPTDGTGKKTGFVWYVV